MHELGQDAVGSLALAVYWAEQVAKYEDKAKRFQEGSLTLMPEHPTRLYNSYTKTVEAHPGLEKIVGLVNL